MFQTIDELFQYINANYASIVCSKDSIKEVWRNAGTLGVFSCQQEGYSKYLLDKLCEYDIYDFPFWLQREVILYLLKRYGTESQKNKYLEGLESGDIIASLALTEESGGSDFKNIRSFFNAISSTLSGEKRFITNAAFADIFFFAAKNSDEKIGIWIIESSKDVIINPINSIHEISALGFSEVKIQDILVEPSMLLGNMDNCLLYVVKALSFERYCCAYMAFQMSAKLWEQNLKWIKKRGTLWDKQSVKFKMAEFSCSIKSLNIYFASLYGKFERKSNIFSDAAMLKYQSVNLALEITQFSALLRAGEFASLDIDKNVNRMYNTIMTLAAAGGTQEVMLRIISEGL